MNDVSPEIQTKTVEVCLAEIEEGVGGMREALLSKKQEAILAAVANQERLLEEFAAVWSDAQRARTLPGESIRKTVGRIRGLLRRNAMIARTFLDLINGTIESLNAKAGHHSCAYDETGRPNRFASPILVHYQG